MPFLHCLIIDGYGNRIGVSTFRKRTGDAGRFAIYSERLIYTCSSGGNAVATVITASKGGITP